MLPASPDCSRWAYWCLISSVSPGVIVQWWCRARASICPGVAGTSNRRLRRIRWSCLLLHTLSDGSGGAELPVPGHRLSPCRCDADLRGHLPVLGKRRQPVVCSGLLSVGAKALAVVTPTPTKHLWASLHFRNQSPHCLAEP